MALGQFADINLIEDATLAGGTWSAALPLANLKGDQYIQRPTRCEVPTVLVNSQFTATLAWPRAVSLIAVVFHTLSISAQYRLTIADLDGSFATPILQTDWTPVTPALWDSADLEWESPNWWTGQPLTEDLDLYPRNLWIPLPTTPIVTAFKLEIDDRANPAGYFDLGGLWTVSGWSPAINFERGRKLGLIDRSQVEEGPSGRRFAEERRGRRSLSVAWARLEQAEAHRLFDAGVRCGTTKPVLFVPDLDDPLALFREAFVATFQNPPSPTFGFAGLHQADATFLEIIA